MHPIHQWAGQAVAPTIPATSSTSTAPTLAQLGYTADQGAEIGMAVSVLPILGLVLGAVALAALSPSDAIPRWIWAALGGGIGLAAGNALGVAAVNQMKPAGTVAQGIVPTGSFDETGFYTNLGNTLSSQIASYAASASAALSGTTTTPAATTAQGAIPATVTTQPGSTS